MQNLDERSKRYNALLSLSYEDVVKSCSINDENNGICDDPAFWEEKAMADFGRSLKEVANKSLGPRQKYLALLEESQPSQEELLIPVKTTRSSRASQPSQLSKKEEVITEEIAIPIRTTRSVKASKTPEPNLSSRLAKLASKQALPPTSPKDLIFKRQPEEIRFEKKEPLLPSIEKALQMPSPKKVVEDIIVEDDKGRVVDETIITKTETPFGGVIKEEIDKPLVRHASPTPSNKRVIEEIVTTPTNKRVVEVVEKPIMLATPPRPVIKPKEIIASQVPVTTTIVKTESPSSKSVTTITKTPPLSMNCLKNNIIKGVDAPCNVTSPPTQAYQVEDFVKAVQGGTETFYRFVTTSGMNIYGDKTIVIPVVIAAAKTNNFPLIYEIITRPDRVIFDSYDVEAILDAVAMTGNYDLLAYLNNSIYDYTLLDEWLLEAALFNKDETFIEYLITTLINTGNWESLTRGLIRAGDINRIRQLIHLADFKGYEYIGEVILYQAVRYREKDIVRLVVDDPIFRPVLRRSWLEEAHNMARAYGDEDISAYLDKALR